LAAPEYRFRLIDTAGSELGIVTHPRATVDLGETLPLPDGGTGTVVDVYDDEYGREGDVEATLALEI
jgi:hypothetical protein